jgi:FixJ family two-component response regulator
MRSSKAAVVAIVDDDDAVREALVDLLSVVGFQCRPFDRAEGLLAEYEPDAFDCVVTDVTMPGMSGFDLLQRLHGLDASVPVIVITSDTNPATCTRAFQSGAHGFLTKPVEDDVLLRLIRSALAHPSKESRDGD